MLNNQLKKYNKIKPINLHTYLLFQEIGIQLNKYNSCFICNKKHIIFSPTPLMSKKYLEIDLDSEIGWKVKCGSKNRYRWEFVCSKDCVKSWLNENRLVSQYSYFPIIE